MARSTSQRFELIMIRRGHKRKCDGSFTIHICKENPISSILFLVYAGVRFLVLVLSVTFLFQE